MEVRPTSPSPALASRLKLLAPAELQRFCEAYAFAVIHGAEKEGEFARTPGASFNPRPSRVCQILWDSAEGRGAVVLSAGVLSCITGTWPEEEVEEFPGAESAYSVFRCLWEGSAAEDAITDRSAGDVLLSHRLDELRHLHMLPTEELFSRLRLFSAERDVWRSLDVHPALITLADAAFMRLARQMEAP